MPLLLTQQITPHTWLGIWQLQENEADLYAALPSYADVSAVAGKVHPRRRQEWLASRVLVYTLLRHFTEAPLALARNPDGKPYFPGQPLQVSITHSPQLAAVILSDRHEVGIDIELITPKALRVSDRFLAETEKQFTAADETTTCLYWSAKETLYKLHSQKRLVLKENLLICPSSEPNVLTGRVQTENISKLYRIQHEIIQGHVLTYCIDSL
ncbi:4'-phosphopantetheinyl transferase superfamily protein [Pontibacter sp. E15-1]|uniref:4'-phosphopantetheinyl transferase family protein n=1 Tax=Pontibacter sp. E15-1 TaxID=2919918 RepID=UPI001F4F9B46|nr:4'-phosphopantetheinyl transferase family protein [Pontibacter sp. E15-1]MCJ8165178.1 4'-phosphopantetheinyl transferase superfamily protein [Pontibacter sp. E15-1]